jgi:t-SNARE complex subunit (syntaxin)
MNDINSIFKDLAVMVHDQGDIVNSIEANIETTQSRIQISNQNLESAVKNQVNLMNKNYKKKTKKQLII